MQIANKGWKQACKDNPEIKHGLDIVSGHMTFKGVAGVFGLPYLDTDSLLAKP